MRFLRIFFILIFLLLSFKGHSQIEKLLKDGDNALSKGNKTAALEIYLQAYRQSPDNPELNLKIGKLYLAGIYRFRSLPYLEKAYKLNPKIDKEIHKYLALAYHYNHQFDKAIENYELCKTTLSKDDSFLARIDREIYECQNGKEFVANPVKAKIENLGAVINTRFAEYGPAVSANESELIFTSRREGSVGGDLDEDGEFFEDIYISRKQGEEWSKPKQISDKINTSLHDASIGLSPDGNLLFIYKSDNSGDILFCKLKKDSTWSDPESMGGHINTKKYYENAAAISPNGNVLFFSSTRPGGYGNLDIFITELMPGGGWGPPVNLGKTINTEYDEEGPVLDLDGKTLYFSSMGHKGMGGFDIFRSVYDTVSKKWSEPQNLGYPINTADDDIYFSLSGDGRHGYYASVKDDGFGDKDIYKITMPERKDYEELMAKVKAIEKSSQLASDDQSPFITHGTKLKSVYENIADDTDKNRFNKLQSDSSRLGNENDPKLYADQQKLRDEARVRFEKMKLDYSNLGDDADPKLRAEKRKLLDEARARYEKLMADSVRLADEQDPKLKAERQKLPDEQRARFEKLKSDSLKLAMEADEKLRLALKKASEEEKMRLQKLKLDSLQLAHENDARLKTNMKSTLDDGYRYKDIFIKNLHFDFDKASLRPESIIELEKVKKLLKENTTIKVKINAHTDNKGSVIYNSTLSKKRNQSVKEWLLSHGISGDRIISEEYGEEKPIASNDFEINGRAINRRVELFIQE
jgi:outer membrane protein OmpA-like peptidoglycan-associated protein/Tol biopolymer transport system component